MLIQLIGFISTKIGKKNRILVFTTICAVVITIVWFLETGLFGIYFYLLAVAFCLCTYFILAYATAFDICEVVELSSGERREGIIMSLFSFIIKGETALGMWIAGLALQYFGFDDTAAEQSAEAIAGIKTTVRIVPAIFLILSVFALFRYPISKTKFKEILLQLEERNRLV